MFHRLSYALKNCGKVTIMKITSFNPLIITPNADETIKVFEALGFEIKHRKTAINDEADGTVSMKDANGFRVDITKADIPHDINAIRMNVRDFDEAYELLTSKGFKNSQGDKVTDTGSSKATKMISPSGLTIILIEHIRKDHD